ncbi:MAG: hypothetical protein V4492_05685 [Chlamydiota bacterium]
MAIYLNPNKVPDMMHESSKPVMVDDLDQIWQKTQTLIATNFAPSPCAIASNLAITLQIADINAKIESSFSQVLEERQVDPLDFLWHRTVFISVGAQIKARS